MNVCTAKICFSLKVRDKHHDDNLMKLGVSYLYQEVYILPIPKQQEKVHNSIPKTFPAILEQPLSNIL